MLEFKNELNSIKDLDFLYSSLGWNKVGLSNVELANMCENSWYVLYVYDKNNLVYR